jgi:molybdenum-dependent DNA-binding transcriptional regulator ModE
MASTSISLDWSLLPAVLSVADHGSLSAAARQTGLSQPTLGRQIRAAEAALGGPLFDRHARGLSPTDLMQTLLPHLRDMQEAAEALKLQAAGQAEATTGTIRLTASHVVSGFLLPPILARFRLDHPARRRDRPRGHGRGAQGHRLVRHAQARITFDVSEDLVGGAPMTHGTPLHDDTMAKAQEVDAVLLGAVGGPKYDVLDFSVKPERGLLRLRKEMDLFANLRPAQCFDALADFSSLKKDVVAGLDIMIVRELTSGVYFGEPRGIFRRATSASASTPSAIPKARSPAWRAPRSSWRGSATTRSARWRRPT